MEAGLSVMALIAYVEVHYRSGFSYGFWTGFMAPVSLVLSLTGFVTYRLRETKALSMGQFLEMRYSRSFRLFCAVLRTSVELLSNAILPAISARFFHISAGNSALHRNIQHQNPKSGAGDSGGSGSGDDHFAGWRVPGTADDRYHSGFADLSDHFYFHHVYSAEFAAWQDLLEHYPPIPKTPEGAFWCGPDVPLDHYFYGGHLLYPAFPAEITDDVKALKKTIRLIETDAIERSFVDCDGKFHMNHDWSAFLVTEAYLRAGERKKGWESALRFLELFAKENGLFCHNPVLIGDPAAAEKNEKRYWRLIGRGRRDSHGKRLLYSDPDIPHPPCVTSNPDAKRLAPAVQEGNSAFLFIASELLLQSHSGIIRLFPGVPNNFTGSFTRFLAQGGFEVSAAMKKGVITQFRIRSLAGGTVKVTGRGLSEFQLSLPKGKVYSRKP